MNHFLTKAGTDRNIRQIAAFLTMTVKMQNSQIISLQIRLPRYRFLRFAETFLFRKRFAGQEEGELANAVVRQVDGAVGQGLAGRPRVEDGLQQVCQVHLVEEHHVDLQTQH